MTRLRESLEDPRRRRYVVWAALALLAWVALLLRWGIDFGGVLDTDTMNFGLAAVRFDVLDHQPHPPGYPGYVLFLKLIHLLAPGLGPVEIAKWGTRLVGLLTIPATYWACRQLLLPGAPGAVGRPLLAAAIAAFHPLLWYYGSDGQSHAAEALLAVLLFGLVFRVRRAPSLSRLLLVVAAFGLAGSLRPTIPLLSSPLLVWLFWGRPLRDWALAFATGVASVAVWAAPLIAMTGGWEIYRRASDSLVGMFIANYSLFSGRAHPVLIGANVTMTLWYGLVALLPVAAWSRAAPGERRWPRIWLAVIALNLLFYATVYIAEAGYLAAVAGLACLAPATWPERPGALLRARGGAVLAASPLFLFFGPADVPIPRHPDTPLPTLQHAVDTQRFQDVYLRGVCGAAGGLPAIVFTDNPTTTHTRQVPLYCDDVALGLYVDVMPIEPQRTLDVWLIFYDDRMSAVPTGVPLEPGPPADAALQSPVEVIIIAPDASDAFRRDLLGQATCRPKTYRDRESGLEVPYLPARCLPALETPTHTIELSW